MILHDADHDLMPMLHGSSSGQTRSSELMSTCIGACWVPACMITTVVIPHDLFDKRKTSLANFSDNFIYRI